MFERPQQAIPDSSNPAGFYRSLPRQVGKTTLARQALAVFPGSTPLTAIPDVRGVGDPDPERTPRLGWSPLIRSMDRHGHFHHQTFKVSPASLFDPEAVLNRLCPDVKPSLN